LVDGGMKTNRPQAMIVAVDAKHDPEKLQTFRNKIMRQNNEIKSAGWRLETIALWYD
jgi:hypothetical protein